MSRPRMRQIMPRRLEVVIEKLDLAKESFEPQSEEWGLLDSCQDQIRNLLELYTLPLTPVDNSVDKSLGKMQGKE